MFHELVTDGEVGQWRHAPLHQGWYLTNSLSASTPYS